jgi:hypothetical protein
MTEGEQVALRYLPEGVVCAAVICSANGKILELDLQVPGSELIPGAAAEIKAADTIYLGVVERRDKARLWINVEHLLDRKTLASIQAAWKE